MLRTSRNKRRLSRRKFVQAIRQAIVAGCLLVIGFLNLVPAGFGDRDALRVWFFDVGQGDAIFLETPDGFQMLIDGGPDRAVLSKLGEVMWPWDRTLDAVLLTHPDGDHLSGLLHVFPRYHVGTFYETGVRKHTSSSRLLDEYARSLSTATLRQGDLIQHGRLTLEILSPDVDLRGVFEQNPNRYSLIVRLTYGSTTVLLTGDSTTKEEEIFASRAGNVDVLKVGHHGSLTSTGSDILETTRPEYSIVSVGRQNTYGHPHPAVVRRLKEAGVHVLRTDTDGDILLISHTDEPQIRAKPLTY